MPTGRPAEPSGTAACQQPKLRPSQRQQRRIVAPTREVGPRPSPEFTDAWDRISSLSAAFTASEAEAYAVAAVCANLGDALKLLDQGKRTAEEARTYMESRGLGHLLADRSELMNEALAKGVRFEDLIWHHGVLWEDRPVPHRIAALRFDASSLSSSYGPRVVRQQLLSGEIDFDDIKAVGIGRLKPHNMVFHFAPLLAKAKRGDEGFDVEAIRALAIMIEEDESGAEFPPVVALANLVGPRAVIDLPSLSAAAYVYSAMKAKGEIDDPDAVEKALYAARFIAAVTGRQMCAAREFYAAGIPLETAIAVHEKGGSVEQAVAIRDGDIAASLAGGFL